MKLTAEDWKHREAANGYAQLGMWTEADSELDKITAVNRAHSVVLAVRIEIYRGTRKWELMREVAKRLSEWDPEDVQWRISYAFATRRAVSIEAAREILIKAARKFRKEPVILFNLACYECQLNRLRLTSSKRYLKRAFAIDPKWRLVALDDGDLRPLWETL